MNFFKMDKIIKITSFLIAVIILILAVLIIPHSIISHQIVNETTFVNRCGLSQDNYFSLFNGNLVYTHMFLYPYNAIEVDSNEYFTLKEGNVSLLKIDELRIFAQNSGNYYEAKMLVANQSSRYTSILKQFQKAKSQYNLDDDQYLQLIVNFVQSMPYFIEKPDVKYPFITFIDSCGDCDDKSLLLVALLSKENYNVSLFIIPPEGPNLPGHAMAGVASKSATFTKKGYAMIETTKKDSAIGRFPVAVASDKVQIIKIGNGSKTFETYASIYVSEEGTYKIIKNGERVLSVTEYNQNIDPLVYFKTHKEDVEWQNDCKQNKIPFYICNSLSRNNVPWT